MKFAAFLVIFCYIQLGLSPIPCDGATNPVEINRDVYNEILEIGELKDLVKMTTLNSHFREMGIDVFNRKYSKKTIVISDSFVEHMPVFYRDLVVLDVKLAAEVIRTYGHLMTSILINYANIDRTKWSKVNEYVSKYCSASLNKLQFFGFTENPMNDFPNYFEGVEVVTLVGEAETIANETAPFNVIFPNVRFLEVSVRNMKDQSWINQRFEHLEQLYTSLTGNSVPRFDEKTIESVFEKNPQIRVAGTGFAPFSFLNKTNVLLPNLETIIIGQFKEDDSFNGRIAFVNVKKLVISSNVAPVPLEFPHLEEVQFNSLRPFDERWTDYFGNFPTIKKINATVGSEMDAIQLVKLAETLPHLTEVAIVPETSVMIDQVLNFIDNCKELVKLTLVVTEQRLIDDFKANDNGAYYVRPFWNGEWGTITIDCKFRE